MYSSEVKKVGEELLRCLSIIMGMEKDTLLGLHKELLQALRVNYYPQCCMPYKVLGLSPHSDKNSITILMQEDNATGLQIRKAGEWVPVKPIPNALVVNVGDAIEVKKEVTKSFIWVYIEKENHKREQGFLSFTFILFMTDME